ncbi:MAG: amidohydrolase family protein [Chitinophagaceae bacterium]|nr:amidohydrolase family protein [Chitinophagaceae bacterium]
MKTFLCAGFFFLVVSASFAQKTFPVNGVADERSDTYFFTNATIVKDAGTTLNNASLLVQKGKIIAVGNSITTPKNAISIDCKGKYITPSFIDIYSDYGITPPQRSGVPFSYSAPAQFDSDTKGAFGWNQAIRSETEAVKIFKTDKEKAELFRNIGFGTTLTHQKDGIARGTGVVVTLADARENLVIVKERASAHYSFSKGTSTQSYPGSLMGSIALLRQNYIDAAWYKNNPAAEGVNLSLKAWNENQSLPQIFEANDKWGDVRADRIGDEFGVQYIIKGGGNEYQRINEIKATKAAFILPVNYPQAMDVEDPNDARYVSLNDLKHWELAPANPAVFEKAGIPFCLTPADLTDPKQFLVNIRKAIQNGLSESKALEALTQTPATLLSVYDQVGSLEPGKLANFLISSGPVFKDKTIIYQNWVQGQQYNVANEEWNEIKGVYQVSIRTAGNSSLSFPLEVQSASSARITDKDTLQTKFSFNGKTLSLSFAPGKHSTSVIRLSGIVSGGQWSGNGEDTTGARVMWSAAFVKALPSKTARDSGNTILPSAKITYPFGSYGWDALPQPQALLFKNATVWTSDAAGKLENTDVLIKDGKIAQVGKNLLDAKATVIDATGKHITAGIIDEHSHIATASINEGAQSVTSEVRIADNLNPDDINIYRQLSGGVTSSHILHGSANTIGGQTQLIKLRWGADDEGLKFKNWDPFIKFALGENVKRTTAAANNRFPDTRMGVEEVLMDAFQRATDYEKAIKRAEAGSKGKKGSAVSPWNTVRRDLELDALVEIMNKKRFITCHSYVQSEITYTMRVAEKFGFRVNTFTHILEGYKVADKMKEHGANVSTFSDWFGYKMEVADAIAYNAAIMQRMGLNVCINSDDAEMARRLNQEAAKVIKYGGVTEEQALNMVTINPAKALHIDDRTGSIKVGKDADLVLWSDHPLSIYAQAEKTMVDGIVYFDRQRDLQLRKAIAAERNRLIQKMVSEKKSGNAVAPFKASNYETLSCDEHE